MFLSLSRNWGGVLRRLEALRDPITGATLHRGPLWGGRFAHFLPWCGILSPGEALQEKDTTTSNVVCIALFRDD